MLSWNTRLRDALVATFDTAGLELLSADLGIDYETLEGDARPKKAFELVDYCARTGRIEELIDTAALRRPGAAVEWQALRAAAIATPEAFRLHAVAAEAGPDAPPIINTTAATALRIGFIAGALLVVLLVCAFSAGIAFGSGSLPLGPRPVPDRIGAGAAKRAVDNTPVGGAVSVALTDGAATALAEDALRTSGVKGFSEVGVRFANNGDMVVTGDFADLGGKQVAIIYGLTNDSGKLTAGLKGAALNLLDNNASSFGWVAIPAGVVQSVPSAAAAQTLMNLELSRYGVKTMKVRQGSFELAATRLR